jgi:hypothetical protein
MGVRQDYYAPFAQWLAARAGASPRLTTGAPATHCPTHRTAPCAATRPTCLTGRATTRRPSTTPTAALPGKPLYLLGHSLGAQLPGLITNQHKVSGLLSVAAGSGYWRENAPQLKRIVPYFWFFLVPLATRCAATSPARSSRKWATCRRA